MKYSKREKIFLVFLSILLLVVIANSICNYYEYFPKTGIVQKNGAGEMTSISEYESKYKWIFYRNITFGFGFIVCTASVFLLFLSYNYNGRSKNISRLHLLSLRILLSFIVIYFLYGALRGFIDEYDSYMRNLAFVHGSSPPPSLLPETWRMPHSIVPFRPFIFLAPLFAFMALLKRAMPWIDIRYFSVPPRTQNDWPYLLVDLGSAAPSDRLDELNVTCEGKDALLIRAKPLFNFFKRKEPSRKIDLIELGFSREDANQLKVYWVNDDGARVLLNADNVAGPIGL